MIIRDVKEEYFNYLCEIIYGDNNHNKLLKYLFDKDYIWKLPLDENRALDGKWLRHEFCNEMMADKFSEKDEKDVMDTLSGPCSLLEMFVALAKRCEDQLLYDWEIGDRTDVWFWEFMDNMGISAETDDDFDENYVEKVCQIFLSGECFYGEKFGEIGNPLPLFDGKNECEIELWERLQLYVSENFEL